MENEKKLFAIDLDGTLFYPKHPIVLLSKKTVSFIKEIEKNGDIFSVVSGRNIISCKKVFEKTGTKPYIVGCNGAFIYSNGKFISSSCLKKDDANKVLNFIYKNYKPLAVYAMSSMGETFVREKFGPFKKLGFKIYDIFQGKLWHEYSFNRSKFEETINENKTWKLMVVFGISKKAKTIAKEFNKEIFKNFGDICSSAWSEQAIEISAKNSEKSDSILKLAHNLNIKENNIYVVGDSGNDIPMFKRFYGNSFCMKHSSPSIKKYAKNTVKSFVDIKNYIK